MSVFTKKPLKVEKKDELLLDDDVLVPDEEYIDPIDEEIREGIVDEERNLYFVIDHSSNRQIEFEEAKTFFKKDVYFTVGTDTYGKIYIFDLEKNSILPEVRYLDGFSGGSPVGGGFNMFGGGFIFVTLLVGVFVYFNFFATEEQTKVVTGNGIFGVGQEKVTEITPEKKQNSIIPFANLETEKPKVTIKVEKPKEEVIVNTNNNDNTVRYLNTEIDILKLEYIELEKDYNDLTSDLNEKSDKLLKSKEEFSELEIKCEEQKKLLLSEDQLFLDIGKSVFERCENIKSDYCNSFIYDFYNLRDK